MIIEIIIILFFFPVPAGWIGLRIKKNTKEFESKSDICLNQKLTTYRNNDVLIDARKTLEFTK